MKKNLFQMLAAFMLISLFMFTDVMAQQPTHQNNVQNYYTVNSYPTKNHSLALTTNYGYFIASNTSTTTTNYISCFKLGQDMNFDWGYIFEDGYSMQSHDAKQLNNNEFVISGSSYYDPLLQVGPYGLLLRTDNVGSNLSGFYPGISVFRSVVQGYSATIDFWTCGINTSSEAVYGSFDYNLNPVCVKKVTTPTNALKTDLFEIIPIGSDLFALVGTVYYSASANILFLVVDNDCVLQNSMEIDVDGYDYCYGKTIVDDDDYIYLSFTIDDGTLNGMMKIEKGGYGISWIRDYNHNLTGFTAKMGSPEDSELGWVDDESVFMCGVTTSDIFTTGGDVDGFIYEVDKSTGDPVEYRFFGPEYQQYLYKIVKTEKNGEYYMVAGGFDNASSVERVYVQESFENVNEPCNDLFTVPEYSDLDINVDGVDVVSIKLKLLEYELDIDSIEIRRDTLCSDSILRSKLRKGIGSVDEMEHVPFIYVNQNILFNQNIDEGELRIFNLNGQCIFSEKFENKSKVQISDLPNGVYIARLEYHGEIYNDKIIHIR